MRKLWFRLKECQEHWADKKSKSKQKRFFKSEVEKREAAADNDDDDEAPAEDEEEEAEVMDCWDMLPETKILPALNKKFQGMELYNITSRSW